ncbi:hypothetical protein I312_104532 [Cryptococcus bacillisporus CA1280]|uniref:uncharacterized protein n=1 Tax=Cryptococcus bacillisporus CA1280 TaxID=1296109 RepID=UPI0033679BF1
MPWYPGTNGRRAGVLEYMKVHEHFMARQRKHESSQYIRTLSGLISAVDATMKVANKASVYSRTTNGKMQVVDLFAGGMFTARIHY